MFKSRHRFWLLTFLAITGLSPASAPAAPSPSFTCSRHMSPDEQAICKNPQLTALDHIANQGYLFLREKLGKSQANKINLPLIRQRQKCKADIVCIEKAQRESIRVFNENGAGLEIPDKTSEAAASTDQSATLDAAPATAAPTPAPPPPTSQPKPEATTPPSDAATTPAPKEAPTPVATPSTATEAENSAPKPAEEGEELLDQPPVESDTSGVAKENGSARDDAASVAEATPNESGARDWRPENDKEIRDESALESAATDMLEKEMAEQAKPVSRQERQAIENYKNKHRIALILAAILFALVVGYAITKLRRDPGARPPATRRVTSAVDAGAPPVSIPPAENKPAPLLQPVTERVPTPPVSVKAGVDAPAAPSTLKPLPPKAWVWSQYRGRF